MILVIGATGQLGGMVVKELRKRAVAVRALIRHGSTWRHLDDCGIDFVRGDLMDQRSLTAACAGVRAVIATATAHIPRLRTDDFRKVDNHGYRNLLESCQHQNVSRFVFCSGVRTERDSSIPLLRLKRQAESYIQASGLEYSILRCSAFMDIAFVLAGSLIPIAGEATPTVMRPYRFAERHIRSVQDSIERRGIAHVPGNGRARHSFICANDVAQFMVEAALSTTSSKSIVDVGGPQCLSWLDVVNVYETILGKRLQVKHTPTVIYRALLYMFSPFSAPAANLMGINYLMGATDTPVRDAIGTAARYNVRLTSAREFLSAKLRLKDESIKKL